MSKFSEDVIFCTKKRVCGMSTASQGFLIKATKSYQDMYLLHLTASRSEYLIHFLPLPASPYCKYHCPAVLWCTQVQPTPLRVSPTKKR